MHCVFDIVHLFHQKISGSSPVCCGKNNIFSGETISIKIARLFLLEDCLLLRGIGKLNKINKTK